MYTVLLYGHMDYHCTSIPHISLKVITLIPGDIYNFVFVFWWPQKCYHATFSEQLLLWTHWDIFYSDCNLEYQREKAEKSYFYTLPWNIIFCHKMLQNITRECSYNYSIQNCKSWRGGCKSPFIITTCFHSLVTVEKLSLRLNSHKVTNLKKKRCQEFVKAEVGN